jgi:PHD/YefM family antitoxin component YafN of YafNO toxin-antitoxin module
MGVSMVPEKDAGRSLPKLLSGLAAGGEPCYITDRNGRARAVLLDIDRYHAMMDAIEDQGEWPEEAAAGALLEAILGRARKT